MDTSVMQDSSSPHPSSDRSFLGYAITALAIALIVRFFIAAPYVVSGASMEPTFDTWDYLITDRISYDIGEPERGDIVIFKLPEDTSRTLIKRVIGLPGETVVINDHIVTITNGEHPEGFVLDEPYLSAENIGGVDNVRATLGESEYFVLGDNRRVSADSRLWGPLPERDIVGKVFVRLFPFNKMGVLPGEAHYAD